MQPINTRDFGLAQHRFALLACVVSASLTKETITAPGNFVNVAAKLDVGDEIRFVAEDYSFVGRLFVTFRRGTDVRVKLLEFTTIEENAVDEEPDERYIIKQKGPLKWCIVDTQDNSNVKTEIPNKTVAYRELDDYLKAMSR